LPLIVM